MKHRFMDTSVMIDLGNATIKVLTELAGMTVITDVTDHIIRQSQKAD